MLKFKNLKSTSNLSYEEAGQVLKRRAFFLFWVAFMHSLFFYIFESEQAISYFDSVWVTLVTFSTIGYGDVHAQTVMGKMTTIVFATFSGIYLLVATIESFVTWRREKRELQRRGNYYWNFFNHIVICNYPKFYSTIQMKRLISEIRNIAGMEEKKVIIITDQFNGSSLPKTILNLEDVVHVNGDPSNPESMKQSNISHASHILILSRLEDTNPDGDCFDIIRRIRSDYNKKAVIISQCEHLENKERLIKSGANNVLKPMPAYPEATAFVLSKPYIEHFIEDFISSEGNELSYFKIKLNDICWSEIVKGCIEKSMGLPIAYKVKNKIIYPDHIFENIEADGFFILRYPNTTQEDISNIIGNKNPSERDNKHYDKIYILNTPACNGFEYFKEMKEQLKKHKRFYNTRIVIISEEIDSSLLDNEKNEELGIEIIQKNPSLLKILKEEKIHESSFVILLANENDNNPDGFNFDIINRLKEDLNYKGYIVCEVEEDYDRKRILEEGANCVIRPLRSYPSMIVRSITSKGSERILEMFFNPHKWGKIIEIDNTYYENDNSVFQKDWKDFVCEQLLKNRCLPLGYSYDNKIIINPREVKGLPYKTIYAYQYK